MSNKFKDILSSKMSGLSSRATQAAHIIVAAVDGINNFEDRHFSEAKKEIVSKFNGLVDRAVKIGQDFDVGSFADYINEKAAEVSPPAAAPEAQENLDVKPITTAKAKKAPKKAPKVNAKKSAGPASGSKR